LISKATESPDDDMSDDEGRIESEIEKLNDKIQSMMGDMDPDTDEIMKLVQKKDDLEDKLYGESIKTINGKKYKAIKEAGTKSIDGEELMNFLMKRFKYSKKQAIATMKKHKMDTSFLKKESVKEEKKSKKHKLQETYERIANRMVT